MNVEQFKDGYSQAIRKTIPEDILSQAAQIVQERKPIDPALKDFAPQACILKFNPNNKEQMIPVTSDNSGTVIYGEWTREQDCNNANCPNSEKNPKGKTIPMVAEDQLEVTPIQFPPRKPAQQHYYRNGRRW